MGEATHPASERGPFVSGSDRFRRLERERPSTAQEEIKPAAAERFGVVERQSAPTPEESGVSAGRFVLPVEVLELDRPEPGDLPFVRCASCKVDSGRTATRCSRCGVSFDTNEQRAFMLQLRSEVAAAAIQERAAAEAHEKALNDSAREQAALKRRLLEGLARDACSHAVGESGIGSESGDSVLQLSDSFR